MPQKKPKQVVHVWIDAAQAVDAKKQILSSETNLLEIIKIMREYNTLRKREFVLKNRLKKALEEIKDNITIIEAELPTPAEAGIKIEKEQIEEGKSEKASEMDELARIERLRKTSITKERNRKIEDELEDIRAKLERLD